MNDFLYRFIGRSRLIRKFSPDAMHPLGVSHTLLTRIRIFLEFVVRGALAFKEISVQVKRTRRLLDGLGNPEILVIANGPSAMKLNWEAARDWRSRGNLIVCVNNYPNSMLGAKLAPDILVLSDPLYKPGTDRLNRLLQKGQEAARLAIFCPAEWVRLFPSTPIPVYGFDDRRSWRLRQKVGRLAPRSYSSLTALKALDISLAMTRNKVIVIGLDNSNYLGLHLSDDLRLVQKSHHATGSETRSEADESSLRYNGVADAFYSTSLQFYYARTLFANRGIENLSQDNLLDAFPRNRSHLFLLSNEK